jgi:transposase-like protein
LSGSKSSPAGALPDSAVDDDDSPAVRDGQVTNRPMYVAIGVTVNGERDILGIWAGKGGEGAKFWLSVLTEIKNRGVADVCIVVCDGLKRCLRQSTPSGHSLWCRHASFI